MIEFESKFTGNLFQYSSEYSAMTLSDRINNIKGLRPPQQEIIMCRIQPGVTHRYEVNNLVEREKSVMCQVF